MIRFLFLTLIAVSTAAAEPSTLSQREFPLLSGSSPDPVRAEAFGRCADDRCRLAALRLSQAEIERMPEAWRGEAAAVNRIIAVYGQGEKPRYAEIDGPAFPAGSPEFAALVKQALAGVDPSSLSEPALRLLEANGRDEAARFWPLATGENAVPVSRAATLDWQRYAYSLILVPGAGPNDLSTPLSRLGDERLRLAVEAWHEGLAPFLLVSGGYVHPNRTPYCEAIEMRRRLEEAYGVPAEAILIDPQARHTTTNIRNAARQVFEYGVPADKPMLIISDSEQIDYIQSGVFHLRNESDLGYQPASLARRLSATRLEATPSRRSLSLDAAADPLDP